MIKIRRLWLVAFGVATLLTVLFPTQHFMALSAARLVADRLERPPPPDLSFTTLIVGELPVWYTWLLLTPLVVLVVRRFPLTGSRRWISIPVHLLTSLACTGVVIMLTTLVQKVLMGRAAVNLTYLEAVWISFLSHFAYFMVIYAAIVAGYHAIDYYGAFQRRALHASRLETRLANAQLSVLKTQLQPHFLFNTLNSIASLMFKDVAAAQRTIVLLSDLLRLSLENAGSHEVPLRGELAFVDRYVEIQKIRFQDRLDVEYDIDPATEQLLVPRLLLQPLVENAIRHGVEKKVGTGKIVVRSALNDGRVLLEVRDNGPGLTSGERTPGCGIGLSNTRSRLDQMYGADHSVVLESLEPSGLAVRIELPRRDRPSIAEPEEAPL